MRITGGTLAGRKVAVPPGVIRPAMDRMRESVFAILGPLDGMTFLDLFAGSGIMALEAVSRGAARTLSVEKDHRKRTVIEGNLALAPDQTALVTAPVERFVARCRDRYDIVFMDPPFDYRFKADLIGRVAKQGIVSEGGQLLIHFPAPESLPEEYPGLSLSDERRYGGSVVRFYDRK